MSLSANNEWWRGAVFYQIYPRSYMDTSGDGIGDLVGIAEKLDYVASLGVDAIWLSPFFKSPMKDYGYDVSDYRDVDPLFGTIDDFRKLLDKAHSLGLKIIIDMVLSHSSDQHQWFQESRASRDNTKADWYVWADPKPDGSPPNNWLAHFGGPSWTYEIRRGQYYLHNFLKEQPDLNLYNPEVRKALFDDMRFWLDMGVDGFRLDAIGCYFHDPKLPDNPPNPNPAPAYFNVEFPTPHSMQDHKHDFLIEPGIDFCKEIRNLLNEYDGRMAVAEVGGEDGIMRAAIYTDGPQRLHTSYNFGLLSGHKASASYIAKVVGEFEKQPTESWPSWTFSNHDVVRVATRWGGDHAENPRFAQMLIALLCSLRGSVFMYQGEELGLPDAPIPYEKIQDPWGKYLYPLWQGRDGCRTPMPWTAHAYHAGFTAAPDPWLPIPLSHELLAVNRQEDNKDSSLNFTRKFLAWRKEHPSLVTGGIEFIDTGDDSVLCFTRSDNANHILCIFNLSDTQKTLPQKTGGAVAEFHGCRKDDGSISLPGFSFGYYSVAA